MKTRTGRATRRNSRVMTKSRSVGRHRRRSSAHLTVEALEPRLMLVGSFQVEAVATGDTIEAVALAHDGGNLPFISFNDSAHGQLRVVTGSSSGWADPLTVHDGASDYGGQSSIAVGTDNIARIAHWGSWAEHRRALRYSTGDSSGNWTTITMPTASGTDMGYHPAIVLDDDNQLHIAHWCFQGSAWHKAFYSYFDGSWHTENTGQDGGHPSIALDSQGNPHIAVRTWGHDLKYIRKDGSN